MTAARGGLLDLLVPDERDRRAIDETLADWREEREQETGPGRLMADARGLLACARVLAASAIMPFRQGDLWRYFFWTLASSVALGGFMTMSWALETSIPARLSLWLALLPGALTFTVGLTAAFGFGLRPGQKLPVLAAIAGGFACVVALAGWLAPESNQYFRETAAMTLNPGAPAPPRGLAEHRLPSVLAGLWSEDPRAQLLASRELTRKAAYVLLWLALIALGESIRRRLADRLPWKVTQAVSGFGALAVAFGTIWAFVPLLVSLPGSWTVYLPRHQANWFASAVVTSLVAWWLVRKRRTRTRTLEPRHPGT
jgi:hypothetical protein